MVLSKAPEWLNQLFLFKKKQQKRLDKMPSNTFKDIVVSESNRTTPQTQSSLTQYSCNPEQKLSVVTKAQVKHTVCFWVNKKVSFLINLLRNISIWKQNKIINQAYYEILIYVCHTDQDPSLLACIGNIFVWLRKTPPMQLLQIPLQEQGGVTHIFPYLPLLGASCVPLETWSRQKSFFSAKR